MEHLFTAVLLGMACVSINAQSHVDNKCDLMTVSDLSDTDSQVIEMIIPNDCKEGRVDWHYPKGSLHLKATLSNEDFAFCIEESWATMLGEVRELTGGLDKLLPLPTEGNPVCTKNRNGGAELLITAQETMYYMTTFKYKLNIRNP